MRSIGFLVCSVAVCCGLLAACATPDLRRENAEQLVSPLGWQAQDVDAGYFVLRTYAPKDMPASDELTIYIEGDGLAWLTESQPSDDPTPRTPMALEMALRHPEGNAVYLARPCQFVDATARRNCRQVYWTDKRFAAEVVTGMNAAISQLRQQSQALHLNLVGYSGGGAMAALLAARRSDVQHLITVAGNLDHASWVQHHRLTPLSGSLNPADQWQALAGVAQTHFVGSDDQTMPAHIARAYRSKFPADAPISLVTMPDFDHRCCWVQAWPGLWRRANYSGPGGGG